ncbi:hypothetical protein EVAR_54443_1 [Eumeta japonica]|uniref:Uncharacterized protein n=1 Tax=Eumeta variegata TaxID=151549 RepID=A0A4C1XM83_EUMVA|nr:hypothetical protein EVAR_54443_1 [Eumeta japonica]
MSHLGVPEYRFVRRASSAAVHDGPAVVSSRSRRRSCCVRLFAGGVGGAAIDRAPAGGRAANSRERLSRSPLPHYGRQLRLVSEER